MMRNLLAALFAASASILLLAGTAQARSLQSSSVAPPDEEEARAPTWQPQEGRKELTLPDLRGGFEVRLPSDLPLEIQWAVPFRDKRLSQNSLYTHDNTLLVLSTNRFLYHMRRSDGVVQWVVELHKNIDKGTHPVVTEKGVYVIIDNELIMIDRDEGKVRWREDPGVPISASPVIMEPEFYFPAWGGKFYKYRLYVKDRTLVKARHEAADILQRDYDLGWEWQISADSHIVRQPEFYEGVFYFGSEDHKVYAVTRDGEVRWRTTTQGKVLAKPKVTPAKLFVGSNDHSLYALNRLTGRPDWQFVTGSYVVDQPYVDLRDSIVLVPAYRNGIFAVEDLNKDFKRLWHNPDALRVAGAGNKYYYLILKGRRLAAVDKKTGDVAWEVNTRGYWRFIADLPNDRNAEEPMRVWVVTEDNVLAVLGEPEADAGPWKPEGMSVLTKEAE